MLLVYVLFSSYLSFFPWNFLRGLVGQVTLDIFIVSLVIFLVPCCLWSSYLSLQYNEVLGRGAFKTVYVLITYICWVFSFLFFFSPCGSKKLKIYLFLHFLQNTGGILLFLFPHWHSDCLTFGSFISCI